MRSTVTKARPPKGGRTKSGGVKRRRDAARSREAILRIATAHFVAQGYNGARIDKIVSDTDTSKNLVYHYFNSKEELFVAVLDRIYDQYSRERGETWRDEPCPVASLGKLAGEMFNALCRMPEMISLLNAENLFKGV